MKEVITSTSIGSGAGAWFLASLLWLLGTAAGLVALRLAMRPGSLRRAMMWCVGATAVSTLGLSLRVSYATTKTYQSASTYLPEVSSWSLASRPFFYITAALALAALVLVLSRWLRHPDRSALAASTGRSSA